MTPFTARNAIKYVAQAAIARQASNLTNDALTDHTRFEKDDAVVEISSGLVGWYISAKLKPITDKMVDKAADFIAEQRAKRFPKKESTEK
jgi:hypothetical protein